MIRILDLFCGGGGAGLGMIQAGAIVKGIDSTSRCKVYYPGTFIHADVFELKNTKTLTGRSLWDELVEWCNLIWTSPPCTAYSQVTKRWISEGYTYEDVDLVSKTRELLESTGKPWVIENVVGAPIREDLMLCGLMFNLDLYRHRIFEISGFTCRQPEHPKHDHQQRVSVYGNPQNKLQMELFPVQMGLYHIPPSSRHFAKAIPPAFSKYIVEEFKRDIQ
jgi:DNA (cytosine-5)-methyltransferase 1